MKISAQAVFKYIMLFIFALFIVFSLIKGWKFFYEKKFGFTISAKFSELGPLSKGMPVYYKGYRVGKIKNITPSEDYRYTDVALVIYMKKVILPENTIAKVKKFDEGKNYIELIYPEKPSENFLKRDSTIEGKTAVDIESFMSAQADSGVLTSMTDNMTKSLKSVERAGDTMTDLLGLLIIILEENQKNLKKTTQNTAKITENLNNFTVSLDSAINRQNIKNTITNADTSTQNLVVSMDNVKAITENINSATKDLDKTISKIDTTIDEINSIASNVKVITQGFCELLGKRFAGIRIMFGRPIKENACSCRK